MGELLGIQTGIITAILDRIIHRAVKVIYFNNDKNYRTKHRTSIFDDKSVHFILMVTTF